MTETWQTWKSQRYVTQTWHDHYKWRFDTVPRFKIRLWMNTKQEPPIKPLRWQGGIHSALSTVHPEYCLFMLFWLALTLPLKDRFVAFHWTGQRIHRGRTVNLILWSPQDPYAEVTLPRPRSCLKLYNPSIQTNQKGSIARVTDDHFDMHVFRHIFSLTCFAQWNENFRICAMSRSRSAGNRSNLARWFKFSNWFRWLTASLISNCSGNHEEWHDCNINTVPARTFQSHQWVMWTWQIPSVATVQVTMQQGGSSASDSRPLPSEAS